MAKKSDKLEHVLIPKHEKISEKAKEKLLEKYNVKIGQLPKVSLDDPAIKHLEVEIGDVVKITRESPTAGESEFYRVVVNV